MLRLPSQEERTLSMDEIGMMNLLLGASITNFPYPIHFPTFYSVDARVSTTYAQIVH